MATKDGLAEPHREWLEARGISTELAAKFGLKTAVASFPPEGEETEWKKAQCIAIPFLRGDKVFNHKYRRTTIKQHVMDKGAPLGLFNEAALDRAAGGTWVVTEGEWDSLIAEDLGWAASSVPNGAPTKASDDVATSKRYEFLWDVREKITKVDRIILATDGDASGLALRADLLALFGPVKCSFIEYPEGCKDLTDVRVKHGVEAASACLVNAKPVPVRGLYKMSDFPELPDLTMTDVLIPGLEGNFGLVAGTFSVITGFAGHGKSSLTLKMIANLLATGTNVTIASFETLAKPILERRLLAAMDENAEHDPTIWKNYLARRLIEERLSIISNAVDDETELDLDNLVDLMEVAVKRHEAKLILLDPYNEVEHKRQRDESQTEYAGRFIRTIKRFCHRTGVAVWLVAHPRKPHTDGSPRPPSLYDISDSANFANKADYGLVIHRPDLSENEIDVQVVKVRMGLPGRCGRVMLQLDASRSRYLALAE